MFDRRSFGRTVGVGAAGVGHTSFGRLKQIRAGELNVGHAEVGPVRGPVVICLHGRPCDIHSFADVAPLLAARGYRVIVPYLRGHGTTGFLSERTFRNAQQAVVALDIIALMDALKIDKAVLAGFDRGSRTADIIAALWPERCRALVSVTGYLITNRERNKSPLPPKAEWAWWYQYYFATERGRLGLENEQYRHDLARLVWEFNSPGWRFDDATFERTATAFDNPDHVGIVVHNYRWRLAWPTVTRATTDSSSGLPRAPRSPYPPSPSTARRIPSRPRVTARPAATSSPAPTRTTP
ncbi:alpha/beta fold hydrolase [Streptomyces sp. NPDC059866]|uniref:alpha/beta fold hydrolase n=1 Tax=Streptomyces sp. NPDC059866 TaxID=3346978 RepID=UPI003667C289